MKKFFLKLWAKEWVKRICFVLACIVVFQIICHFISSANEQQIAAIIERPNCTLVLVDQVDDSFWADHRAYGYVDNSDINAFADGSLTGSIIVRHPFEENGFVIVDSSDIKSIQTITKFELIGQINY